MEKPRDASGQSEIRVQIPLCLQMPTDCIGDFGKYSMFILISVYFLRTYFVVMDYII